MVVRGVVVVVDRVVVEKGVVEIGNVVVGAAVLVVVVEVVVAGVVLGVVLGVVAAVVIIIFGRFDVVVFLIGVNLFSIGLATSFLIGLNWEVANEGEKDGRASGIVEI